MKNKSLLYLFYVGTIKIQKRIRLYRRLLNSDKFFTKEEYRYFGGRIYELRLLRKEMAKEMALRTIKLFKNFNQIKK